MRSIHKLFEYPILRPQLFEQYHTILRNASRRQLQTIRRDSRAIQQSRSSFPYRTLRNDALCARQWRPPRRRPYSSKPSDPSPHPTAHLGSPQGTPSLSQRLRKMSREYGWTALGVYMALSALDFPFCLLAVRMLGTERIGRWEHTIVRGFWDVISMPFPQGEDQVRRIFRAVGDTIKSGMEAIGMGRRAEKRRQEAGEAIKDVAGLKQDGAVAEKEWDWGVEEAQKEASKENASWATQLALAYAVHKSFIFIRVPLTAAILPRVVKTLRGWGWNIGKVPKRTPKAPKN